ncbi:restriction endonuclease subunit S, partial [Leyella stercorea]|uniref:restriction endonuclease subunit S n=1 Tax=Leyella stercorea TaxID=363265 RepID=UPI003AF83803
MTEICALSSYYEKILATGEVKCIDEEIPFEIPVGWEWCRLNDLALYRKGPFGSSLTKSMFVAKSTQSIKVYEQKNAIQKDCTLGDYYISKEKFETMQSFVVKPNDIIVSCAGTIGETYLLPSDAPVGIINQALMRVTLFDLNMVEYWQIYFAYMLLNEAQMKGSGSAIKNIPPFEYLKAVLVPIPPLSEQNRLVERYNILLSLIGKYELEANKLNFLNQKVYDKLKKSVLQEAIRGKLVPQLAEEGTAQELLEQIKAEKEKLVKEGKLKKSALNDTIIYRGDDNKYYEQ